MQKIRSFFQDRKYLEVETPLISAYPAIDLHLDNIEVINPLNKDRNHYLVTSPEYHMKRLLSAGSGSIFQIGKAFRKDESGDRHNPEFTLIEWYNTSYKLDDLIREVDQLLQLALSTRKAKVISYQDAFIEHLSLNPFELEYSEFKKFCEYHNHIFPESLNQNSSKDDLLHYLMGMFLEPKLGLEEPEFIKDYPASQACLARKNSDGKTAGRFEGYYHGMELCNGYYELADAEEQLMRFHDENRMRKQIGKTELEIDHNFLEALKGPFPECCGVALGFDRLFMLSQGIQKLDNAVSFSWNRS